MTSAEVSRAASGPEELIDIGDEVVVRQHHAFGEPGSAARVGERGDGERGIMGGSGKFAEEGREQVGRKARFPLCSLWRLRVKDAAQAGESSEIHIFQERGIGD